MILKFGTISIFLLTLQASDSFIANPFLDHKPSTHIKTCLGNESIEVKISKDLTCRIHVVTGQDAENDCKSTGSKSSYKLHVDAKPWDEARKVCEDEGAHLAILKTEADEKIILDMLKKQLKNIVNARTRDQIWIGGRKNAERSEWITVLGYSLDSTGYVKWSDSCLGFPPEPNNVGGNEDCISLYDGITCQGLNDLYCGLKCAFVCEKSNSYP